jgi:hypothetical protein
VSSQYGRERGGRPWALLRLSSQLPDLPRGRLGAPTAIYLTTGCGLSLCAEVPDSLEECLDLYCNAGANEVHPPPPSLTFPPTARPTVCPLPLPTSFTRANEVTPAPGALRAACHVPARARVCAGAREVGGLGCWRLLPPSHSCR